MSYIEHTVSLTTQADADAIATIPVDTKRDPATLESVIFNIVSVAGSPTAITLDLNTTDGDVTNTPILAAPLGVAAAVVRMEPDASAKANGTHIIPIGTGWRYNFDLNFTAGSTPTVTGTLTFRWRV